MLLRVMGLPVVQGDGGEVVEVPVEIPHHFALDVHQTSQHAKRGNLQQPAMVQ